MNKRFYNVIRKCPFTGDINTMRIFMDIEDWNDYLNGKLVQDALPYLSADEREFVKTGITPEQWEKTFG